MPLDLNEGDKFAILALANVSTDVTLTALADGTLVVPAIPNDLLDDFWKESLGTIATDLLRRCNLALVRKKQSDSPAILDAEHEDLFQAVVDVFWFLQLGGIPHYERATVLKGSVVRGRVELRALDDLSGHQFILAKGGGFTRITRERLDDAARHAVLWRGMVVSSGRYSRLKRGLNVLMDGLQEHFGQERLHACVRALEALILASGVVGRCR